MTYIQMKEVKKRESQIMYFEFITPPLFQTTPRLHYYPLAPSALVPCSQHGYMHRETREGMRWTCRGTAGSGPRRPSHRVSGAFPAHQVTRREEALVTHGAAPLNR